MSTVLGAVSMLSSLLLVWAALDSPNEGSLFKKMGLPVPDYGQIVMIIYLKVGASPCHGEGWSTCMLPEVLS